MSIHHLTAESAGAARYIAWSAKLILDAYLTDTAPDGFAWSTEAGGLPVELAASLTFPGGEARQFSASSGESARLTIKAIEMLTESYRAVVEMDTFGLQSRAPLELDLRLHLPTALPAAGPVVSQAVARTR
ncbi:hypothetical protein [Streptomyces albireticuli]|uniref:Uncharacterized protein n=1 Tax=Streptomyces albireticuli TaxID=1940 RepID=A0A2A2D5G8_9ACTN|nr:hypothetical protein [Streptomyces albireticuli]MCD9196050.1 hypothetical protein [Streptomyces albireticuli]PAU46560.1 hypothetical protein CK936_23490 [Streptomyces albireticuli]